MSLSTAYLVHTDEYGHELAESSWEISTACKNGRELSARLAYHDVTVYVSIVSILSRDGVLSLAQSRVVETFRNGQSLTHPTTKETTTT